MITGIMDSFKLINFRRVHEMHRLIQVVVRFTHPTSNYWKMLTLFYPGNYA
jgi:hypothetical protein